jgi:hypothetical protein
VGYTTDFNGQFDLDKPLTPEHKAYLEAFARSRRMCRNARIAEKLPDPVRLAAGLPIGKDGAYFVGTANPFVDGKIKPELKPWLGKEEAPWLSCHGQVNDQSVVEYNGPPKGQPGLWCQWIPNDDGTAIIWDEGEKFYNYTEWLRYLIEHFLKPWGYVLSGEVQWSGEEQGDVGKIIVKDNSFRVVKGRMVFEEINDD